MINSSLYILIENTSTDARNSVFFEAAHAAASEGVP
jgi:hypothetical protein